MKKLCNANNALMVKDLQPTTSKSSNEEEPVETITTNIFRVKKLDQKCLNLIKNQRKCPEKIRFGLMNAFSKLQAKYSLSMECLFLAGDIFDKCRKECVSVEEVNEYALVSLMLACKYEEVYPPCLDTISRHLRISSSFSHYLQLEILALLKLEFNLNLGSPIKLLTSDQSLELSDTDWWQAMLLLEISAVNSSIRSKFKWNQIVESVKIIFKPLDHENQCQWSEQALLLCKKLIIERSHLEQNYYWLFKKYSSAKYGAVSMKAYSLR